MLFRSNAPVDADQDLSPSAARRQRGLDLRPSEAGFDPGAAHRRGTVGIGAEFRAGPARLITFWVLMFGVNEPTGAALVRSIARGG